jgi:hypothetical protein
VAALIDDNNLCELNSIVNCCEVGNGSGLCLVFVHCDACSDEWAISNRTVDEGLEQAL